MLHTRCLHSIGSYSISACTAKSYRLGCNLAAFSNPFFGTNSLVNKSRPASQRQLRSTNHTMAKVDDPSQAFHSGQAKARSALDETSNGEFKRTDSTYRDHIKQGTRFEPEGMSLPLILSTLPCVCSRNAGLPFFCTVLYGTPSTPFASFTLGTVVFAAGRYHLYIAYACPWASRCLAVRNLKASRCNSSCAFQATVFSDVNISVGHVLCLPIQGFNCLSSTADTAYAYQSSQMLQVSTASFQKLLPQHLRSFALSRVCKMQ